MTASFDFTIYTKPQCPVCEQSKSRIVEYGLTYVEAVIGEQITREETLQKFPWATTAPIIVDNKRNMFVVPKNLEQYLRKHYDSD